MRKKIGGGHEGADGLYYLDVPRSRALSSVMNSVELENGEEESTEAFADELHLVGSPGTDDVNDEPPACPRIGDQYQVEIPTLVTESECLQLRSHPISTDNMLDDSYIFGLGLAIPVMWIHHIGDHVKDEQDEFLSSKIGTDEAGSMDLRSDNESHIDAKCIVMGEFPVENSSSHDIYSQGSACKIELIKYLADLGKESGSFTSQGCSAADDQMNIGSRLLHQSKAKGYSPLPGSPAPSWSNTEKQSFLLGLYIFGKNLVQVKEFMEYKNMGDVLSYYYGKFYRSDAYRRWSECRKIRSRKCILGQRIFTGWRQQELLSRVLPMVSKEGQDTLLEVTKTFNDGRVSLEEFVFTLKAIVGMEVFVESIGIGKGKNDLTGIVLDPIRANQSVSVRPEVPIGKECSSLSSGDIIKFLTGDFRLSKARSNDLFWEAVWPRLLARGWHSEQPKDFSSVVSKHALVFLIPGVKKFSRKKLVKGNHYFDSISDVLNKVASDPRLLDLEVQGGTESSNIKNENVWAADNRSDQNGLSDHPRHCYLRPRLPNCHSELMKFTVVDTSMVQGEGPIKVRELRSLPVDSTYDLSTCSGEMGSSSSSEQLDSDDSSSDDHGDSDLNTLLDKKLEKSKSCMISKDTQYHPSDHMVAVSITRMLINGHVPNDQCVDRISEKLPITDSKCQFSCRAKSDQQDYLTPAPKRRRLTACKYERTCRRTYSFPKGHQLKKEEIHYDLHSSNPSHTTDADVDLSQGKAPVNTSTNHSPDGNSICAFSGEHYAAAFVSDTTVGEVKPQLHTFIDLNLPHIPTACETAEPFSTEVAGSQDYLNPEELACPPEKKQQYDHSQIVGMSNGVLDEQPSITSRRQSTRSRPPTTRALEALACGFLGTKRKGRETRVSPSGNHTSRSSRWVRKTETSVLVPSTSISAVSSDIKDPNSGTNEWCGSSTDHTIMFNDSYVESEEKGTHQSVEVP